MSKPIEHLEVTIFEWPDRFFVESEEKDSEYRKHFKGFDDLDEESLPYLVDLSEYEDGKCGCRDFAVNVEPFLLTRGPKRTRCKHLIRAHLFRDMMGDKPKSLPPLNL